MQILMTNGLRIMVTLGGTSMCLEMLTKQTVLRVENCNNGIKFRMIMRFEVLFLFSEW